MNMFLKALMRTVGLVCAVAASSAIAQAQEYPSKPIKILVGFAAGGGVDTVARLYAQKLHEAFNVPIIVENRPGASELLAAMPVIRSEPDGYTLWMTSASSLVRAPGVRTDLPYDPLKNLTFISRVATVEANYVVKNDLNINTVSELIDYALKNPGKLNYGSAGIGSSNHLLVEQLKLLTKTDMVHIPYKSDSEVAREVAAGTIDFGIAITPFTVPFVLDGRIKAIGVTGSQRVEALPDVPTIDEGSVQELKGLGNYLFYGLVGPADMPQAVVQKLNNALTEAARMPDVIERLGKQNFQPVTGTPEEFRKHIEKELPKWKEVGKTVKVGNY
jgi:tripartite-type tricarboxylate transporter receptor subunit TctC